MQAIQWLNIIIKRDGLKDKITNMVWHNSHFSTVYPVEILAEAKVHWAFSRFIALFVQIAAQIIRHCSW